MTESMRMSPIGKSPRSPSPSSLIHTDQQDAVIHRRSPSPRETRSHSSSHRISVDHENSSVAGSTSSSRLASPSPPRRGMHSPEGNSVSHRRSTSSNASVVSVSSSVAHSESGYMTTRRNNRSIGSASASVHSFSSSATPTTRSNHYYIHSSSSASSSSDVPRLSYNSAEKRRTYGESRAHMNASSIDEYDSPKYSDGMKSHHREYSGSSWRTIRSTQSGGTQSDVSIKEEVARIQITIDELFMARGHPRRLTYISHALQAFDHQNMYKHNLELGLKAPEALSHLLFHPNKNDEEIRMICSALEMVYRGSATAVKSSFWECGKLMIPEWFKLSEQYEENSRLNRTIKATILSITRIFLYFSRVPDLRPFLAQQTGMLAMLSRVCGKALHGKGMEQCREDRMKILANLCNSHMNKSQISENNDIMDFIYKVALQDDSWCVREYAAACLMDLSSSDTPQSSITISNNLIQVLLKLSNRGESDSTREYAITSIQNISFARENRVQLLSYENGSVLGLLSTTMVSDRSKVTRRRAAGALTNIGCSNTAIRMASYPNLVESMAKVCALDPCPEVQHRACRALTKISCYIDSSMPCYALVLNSLVRASTSSNATGIPMVLRIMSRKASNRVIMGQQYGLMELLSSIASSKVSNDIDRESCIKVMAHLANESSCRKSLCNKWILGALVTAANWDEPDHAMTIPESELVDILKSTRDSAILAIERLAMDLNNRPFMARQKNLLAVVAKAAERESRLSSLNASHEPKVARALLMSLILVL